MTYPNTSKKTHYRGQPLYFVGPVVQVLEQNVENWREFSRRVEVDARVIRRWRSGEQDRATFDELDQVLSTGLGRPDLVSQLVKPVDPNLVKQVGPSSDQTVDRC